MQDRKEVLRLLLEKLEDGSYELYFLNENTVKMPKELFITSYSISDVMLVYLSEQQQSRIMLIENSLTRILYESFQNLMKNPQVSTKETAHAYVKKLLDEMPE